MSMETNESDLDLIYMSDWSADMHGHDGSGASQHHLLHQQAHIQVNRTSSGGKLTDIPPTVSYANVFPGVRDDNDNDTVTSNTPMPFGMKKNVIPTITTIYEPKFFEIYQQYHQFILHNEPELIIQNPNQQHLMTLCMNYLLSFSNWARDAVNGNWIRATLFENPDMRPEVRNGLAMIIVYVFASAKSADAKLSDPVSNTDMFTVLMKAESGMGIVNKTSLKIYSDPFGYFNFIKTCISGLIDASAIPENERISTQATKKSRRGSRNKDEVESYQYVKNQLIAMFQSPDSLQLAKDRINQILEFWHIRGKMIRNERFTSVFSLPPPIPGSSNTNNAMMQQVNLNALTANGTGNDMISNQQQQPNAGSAANNGSAAPGIFHTMSAEYITIPMGRTPGARLSNRSSQGSNGGDSTSVAYFNQQQQQQQQMQQQQQQQQQQASLPYNNYYNNSNNNNSNNNNGNAMNNNSYNNNQAGQFNHHYGSGGYPGHLQVNDNDSVVSDSGMSSASRSPHPSFFEANFSNNNNNSSSARSSGAMNFRYTNTTNLSALEDNTSSATTSHRPTESSIHYYQQQQQQFLLFQQQQQQQQQQQLLLLQQQQQIAQGLPIPAIRFDRQGMLTWSVTTSLIYDLDQLLQLSSNNNNNGGRMHFYLVDEVKMKRFLAQEIIMKNTNANHQHSNVEEEILKASTFGLQISYQQASQGFGSLEKLLLKSNAMVTSWLGGVDANQMRVFVDGWRNHVAAATVAVQNPQMMNLFATNNSSAMGYNNNNSNSMAMFGRRSASNSHVYTPPNMMNMLNTTTTTNANNNPANNNNNTFDPNNANNNANNSSTGNGNSTMMVDDNVSVSSSASNNRQPRLSRRRTTGGMDLKRDMAKFMQLQQQEQQQTQQQQQQQQQQQNPGYNNANNASSQPILFINNPNSGMNNASQAVPAMFSPPKNMSPNGLSPSFTFNKSFAANTTISNNGNGNGTGNNIGIPGAPGSAMTSPLAGPPAGAASHSNSNSERKSFNNNSNNNNNNNYANNVAAMNMSMLDYWYFLNNNNGNNNGTSNNNSSSSSVGRGILVFERSNEIGLVVRANSQYGLHEDLWCLYYPDDAMQQFVAQSQQYDIHDRLAQSFAAYLMQLLPQLRQLMKYLLTPTTTTNADTANGGGQNNGSFCWQGPITVSYYAHTTNNNNNNNNNTNNNGGSSNNNNNNNNNNGPPTGPTSAQQYRTLGSIDQNAHLLLSRLASEAYFHEIVLL